MRRVLTEIQQHAHFTFGGAQVVEDLLFTMAVELLQCLQFHDHRVFYDHIGTEVPNTHAAKVHRYGNLPGNTQAGLHQRQTKSFFVQRFQKTITKLVVDVVEDPDDLLRQLTMLEVWIYFSHDPRHPRSSAAKGLL